MRSKNCSSVILVFVLVLGCWTSARAQSEITLLAPRSMQPTIDKIVANFQTQTGDKVR
jgi:ABC-type molybdate transport system substrate-binding protein